MSTYVDRYRAGEYEQVWSELIAQGNRVRNEPLYSDAVAVSRETMRRAKHNIELLVQRLKEMNYAFLYPEEVCVEPHHNVASQLDELEALVGTIPLSLRSWYEVVGSVCLAGSHPTLASYEAYGAPSGFIPHPQGSDRGCYSDPLWMFSLEDILDDIRTLIKRGYPPEFTDGHTRIDISPDVFHKSNISGGPSYCIRVPDAAIDAVQANEEHHLYLVEYLRLSFQWGGFPGFDLYGKMEFYGDPDEIPSEELARLSEGLLPI